MATKIWPLMPVAPLVVDRGRRSARRLKVDTIDLYQVHQANPFVPDGTTMNGMRQLQRDGVIRHVGVSNYSLDRWKRAEWAFGAPVVSNQVEYSLAARSPDRDLVPFAAASDRLIIAYSPPLAAASLLVLVHDGLRDPTPSWDRDTVRTGPLAELHDVERALRLRPVRGRCRLATRNRSPSFADPP